MKYLRIMILLSALLLTGCNINLNVSRGTLLPVDQAGPYPSYSVTHYRIQQPGSNYNAYQPGYNYGYQGYHAPPPTDNL